MNWIWVTAVIAFLVGMTMGMDGAVAYVVGLIMGGLPPDRRSGDWEGGSR